ncbi:MAG: DUF3526 domain-containing protein [Gammaproteobacteria bacterium]|nr:DUF3526 domain-containing protein [Gammaproteobacteria bacterium]
MIIEIATKEFRQTMRDGRFRLAAVLFIMLTAMAFVTAALRYQSLSAERVRAQKEVASQWMEQGEKNPHSAAHYGQYAFRPALPLAFFDSGVQAFEGVSIWLEAHKRNYAAGRPADDMSPLARFGEISLAYILQVLLPLILLLIAYPSFAAERESGTLRQVMASGVTGGQLFLGKFVGLSASVLLLMLPIIGISCLVLVSTSGAAWLAHVVLLAALYLWFMALMLGLALLVSAVASTARAALLVLLVIWALGNFVVPRIAADMGRLASPTPSADALLRAIEDDLAAGIDGETPAAKIEKRRRQLHALYKVSSDAELPINIQGVIFGIQDEISDAVYDRHFSALEAAIDRQVDIFETASILSPRMAVMLVSQEISGTSIGHQRQFADGAEGFRRELMKTLNRDITLNSRSGDNAYRSSAALWREAGEYRFVPERLGASIARCGAPLTVLVLWTFLIGALAWVAARRLGKIG